jgi:ankyrin repeat protein
LVNELSKLTCDIFKWNANINTYEFNGNVHEHIISFLREYYSKHDDETLKALKRMKIDWIENANLLCVAAEYNEIEIVKWLLDIGYSANGYSSSLIPYGKKRPIYISSFNGNYEITKLLLDYGADPNPEKNTPYDPENPPTTNPIFEAIKKNYYDIVKLLLDYGCDPNAYGDQFNELEVPLFVAISCNNIELTRLLLDRGAKLDYTTIKYLSVGHTTNIHGVLKRYSCNNEHMINLLKEYGLKPYSM